MIQTQFNIFDAIIIFVLVLSCLFAFFRGFVREVLSLGAWIGAGVITIYYFPGMTEFLKPYFKSSVGAAGISTLILYTTSLIGFSIINSLIMKFLKSGSDVGMLDNLMGLCFGAARGAFIVCLGYFMLSVALPEKEYPEWLKRSITRPYVEKGTLKLVQWAPDYLSEISNLQKKAQKEVEARQQEIEEDVEKKAAPIEGEGYGEKPSRSIQRMMEGMEQ